jgi:hypothetical protein
MRVATSSTRPPRMITNSLSVTQRLPARRAAGPGSCGAVPDPCQSGTHAVTVISTSSSGAFSAATVTVVLAGLSVGKYRAYSSL